MCHRNFCYIIYFKLVVMCISKSIGCWIVADIKGIIVSVNLLLSGKNRISCISPSDIKILVVKWFLRLSINQCVIINKLLCDLLNCFHFSIEGCGNKNFYMYFVFFGNMMWQFFLNVLIWFDISWVGSLIRMLLPKFMWCGETNGVLKKRAGNCSVLYIPMLREALWYFFVIDLVRIILCWCSWSKYAKSRLW